MCDNVISLLKVSATNSTEEHKTEGCYGCEDKHYFLDIDMAILGMGPADYEKYTNHVREEYAFLDDETYKELRIKVSLILNEEINEDEFCIFNSMLTGS